jgi:hypothetical protein
MHHWIMASLLIAVGIGVEVQEATKGGDDKKPDKQASSLQEKIDKADIIVVGKVSQVGLSAASSFDVGVIEVREVLKGKEATKTVHFRFSSRGDGAAAEYGKKGVEGVWILGKEGAYMSARDVLSYQPLTEVDAVKKLLAKKAGPPADKKK